MNEAVLVLNAGSSSLKFAIYQISEDGEKLSLVVRGLAEGLGTEPRFKVKDAAARVLADMPLARDRARTGHADAFAHLLQWARGQFGDALNLGAVGHRVVHGGAMFTEPALLDDEVVAELERLVPLAPLHQPYNLAAVRSVRKLRPDLPQVACFDTAFHRGRASVSERFGLPDEFFERGVRRWGFHGLSYASIVSQLREAAPQLAAGRVVVAHLGSGASMCAIRGGRSVDTTMSFSTLDGLPMGTRCGSLDPGAVLFLLQSHSALEIETLLYHGSGLRGMSGVSNDVRELLASDDPRAANAIEFFVYRAVREIGSLTAALEGLDALIFTAGIGENAPVIRHRICRALGWLGVKIDQAANDHGRGCISPAGRSPSVWVIPTDEESVIAAGTWAAVRKASKVTRRASSVAGPRSA